MTIHLIVKNLLESEADFVIDMEKNLIVVLFVRNVVKKVIKKKEVEVKENVVSIVIKTTVQIEEVSLLNVQGIEDLELHFDYRKVLIKDIHMKVPISIEVLVNRYFEVKEKDLFVDYVKDYFNSPEEVVHNQI